MCQQGKLTSLKVPCIQLLDHIGQGGVGRLMGIVSFAQNNVTKDKSLKLVFRNDNETLL